jgi:hypothetical protein
MHFGPNSILLGSDGRGRRTLFVLPGAERLNTGGIRLTEQEIRACVFGGALNEKLGELSRTRDFRAVVKLTKRHKNDGTAEECVLRFFAFLDRYRRFEQRNGVS